MYTVGIIAEYNPFHKGHAYQIQQIKKNLGNVPIIVVMSGSFVQRGEPAVMDKWTRTEMALSCGVDLVLELPVVFSCAPAENFAKGSIHIMDATGCISHLCCGAECGDIHLIRQMASAEETPAFRAALKNALAKGLSYPAAREKAALETNIPIPLSPNDILAVEYQKALQYYHSEIQPYVLQRKSNYHAEKLETETFPSATAIRLALKEGNIKSVLRAIPQEARTTFLTALEEGKGPVWADSLADFLHFLLLRQSADNLTKIFEVTEGLENRILSCAQETWQWQDMIRSIKTKRYTESKIRRILIHVLLGLEENICKQALSAPIPYLRVLGFRKERSGLLGEIEKKGAAPLLINPKDAKNILSKEGMDFFQRECLATDLYQLLSPNPAFRKKYQDFTHSLIII